jgi:tetrahydromethanopterin S-methyltransferase subunit G
MKKKEIKKNKIKPRTKAEIKENQFGVILEDVRHQFGIMSEGFLGVNKRFDELSKKIDDNHEEFVEFKYETNENFKTLFSFRDETNSNFKTVFEYLSKIDDRIQFIESEIADLKNILKDKAGLDRVTKVEKEMIIIKRELALCRRQ